MQPFKRITTLIQEEEQSGSWSDQFTQSEQPLSLEQLIRAEVEGNRETAAPTPGELAELHTSLQSHWVEPEIEGQLAVDVYQQNGAIVIMAPIAGVKGSDIDIVLQNDLLTIRGRRQLEEGAQEDAYWYRECYWGAFSRSLILPTEVNPQQIQASLKNGVLKIILPTMESSGRIAVIEEVEESEEDTDDESPLEENLL